MEIVNLAPPESIKILAVDDNPAALYATSRMLRSAGYHVIEATTGQNGLEQARKFTETSAVTGIILTKLDGTAKGGVVVAISRELNLPIRYVGVGEQLDDHLPFDPTQFVASLFD